MAPDTAVSRSPVGTAVAPPAGLPAGVPYRRAAERAWAALRRTPVSMWNNDVSDWADALTYYAILALLPALLVSVSVIGLVSRSTTDALVAHVSTWAPAQSGAALRQALGGAAGRSTVWILVATGGASALWSASSYLAVFRRALHVLHGAKDTRPAWRRAHRIVLTAATLLVLLLASALVLVLSGPLAQDLGQAVGLGGAGGAAWSLVKFPTLLFLVALLVLVLFRSGPSTSRGLRRSLPGGVLAALLWLAASAAFTVYAGNFGSYGRLYGSLAGVVVFLVWLWVSNLALLAGAQFTVELDHQERAARPTAQLGPAPTKSPATAEV